MTSELINKNNFIMPAEWEKHSATWLAWPNDDDYFGDRIKDIENIYLKIIFALHKDEAVKLVVLNQDMQDRVSNLLRESNTDLSKIIFFQADYIDVWIRDYGPTFIKNKMEKAWVKWNYNNYGGKFPELSKDNEVFLNLQNSIGLKMIRAGIDLEGGAIESNGQGVLITTKECLLLNRNFGKNKEDYELIFEKLFGIKKTIWLNKGLLNDHTDGHIDDIVKFIGPNRIIFAFEDNPEDENYERLVENYKILENTVDQNGNSFEIVKLPMPHMHYNDGEKIHQNGKAPVSYINFYIGNGVVLMPIFNDPNDDKAKSIIQSCFPDKKIISIDCQNLIYGGGTIHCITQQEPEL